MVGRGEGGNTFARASSFGDERRGVGGEAERGAGMTTDLAHAMSSFLHVVPAPLVGNGVGSWDLEAGFVILEMECAG